jgi:hypothetical protein
LSFSFSLPRSWFTPTPTQDKEQEPRNATQLPSSGWRVPPEEQRDEEVPISAHEKDLFNAMQCNAWYAYAWERSKEKRWLAAKEIKNVAALAAGWCIFRSHHLISQATHTHTFPAFQAENTFSGEGGSIGVFIRH